VRQSPLRTPATIWHIAPAAVDRRLEQLAGETSVLAVSLAQCHFVHLTSHMFWFTFYLNIFA
jgi:hypothetical protein